MEVELKIIINVDEMYFNDDELREDILDFFPERTGYEIQQLEID